MAWEPIFCPRKFCADHLNMQFEQFKLDDHQLENYGITITKLRRRI